MDVLNNGKLLKEVNATTITLIPKVKCPKTVVEFRPISCCNTLYKCITKVLCNRLRTILPDLILENQGGFMHGRYIAHNIMVIQDLMLEQLGFPRKFILLVMGCVTSPRFSLFINGAMKDFFPTQIGLRQGDPMSPLLFVICMEYLSRVLHKMSELNQFKFHPRCKELKLTHMCFADDLILCCKGEFASIYLLMGAFKLFSHTSGLNANIEKSALYTSGMPATEVQRIIDASGFTLSIFSASKSATRCDYYSGKPGYIAWEQVCTSKNNGGLGFRDVKTWNIASMGKYVWAISFKQDNVWIKWELLKACYTSDELTAMTSYSVKAVYEKLKGEQERVVWGKFVWNRLSMPKHRFIHWLAVQGKLQTTEKLKHIGVSDNDLCLLCGSYTETHQHLFFKCKFSNECMQGIKNWLGVKNSTLDLHQLCRGVRRGSRTKFQKQMILAGIATVIYHVWRTRNVCYLHHKVDTISSSIKMI
ncbi:uncharacterized protein LOC104887594 [Beta vulgaris subsp. vulgaris]|uniref:uncharacterized protein LOC104887594 n=1 Tax=Beta vulgaris subsp. vulgaris TaxID=3555 RepID=UPI0020368853|nr:uncharacterized protein LOC104887594 [Beta vulgaris subsp. vulgaris]